MQPDLARERHSIGPTSPADCEPKSMESEALFFLRLNPRNVLETIQGSGSLNGNFSGSRAMKGKVWVLSSETEVFAVFAG
jgi:hypothetical protein